MRLKGVLRTVTYRKSVVNAVILERSVVDPGNLPYQVHL